MPPTAAQHAIVISSGTTVVTVPAVTHVETAQSPDAMPKYAIGLFDTNRNGPRKRKRLTHLTPEEKIMRRKLKNRVAAQTARDRKRIKMESLEDTVQKFQQQAKELLDVNMKLLKRAEALEQENADLRRRLGLTSEVNPTVSGNRETVERIRVEFDDTLAVKSEPEVPDSVLSPDESADENDGCFGSISSDYSVDCGIGNICVSTMECVSPEPAAGRCQILVDPLRSQHNNCSSSSIHGSSPDDILGILEQIDSDFKSETSGSCNSTKGFGLDKTFLSSCIASQYLVDSIKELINVDHLYSKPIEELKSSNVKCGKPTFKVQLSGSVPSTKLIKQPSSSMIKVDLTVKPENKPIVLFKAPSLKQEATVEQNRYVAKLAQTYNDSQPMLTENKLHPMLCDSSTQPDVLSLMDFDHLDAELESILNDQCNSPDMPLVSPVNFDGSVSPKSDVSSDTSNASTSQLNSIDTPLLSDMLDPFDFQKNESLFSDAFSAELFPQLATVI